MSLFYISFDDTDNVETIGTGHILQAFLEEYAQGRRQKELLFTDEPKACGATEERQARTFDQTGAGRAPRSNSPELCGQPHRGFPIVQMCARDSTCPVQSFPCSVKRNRKEVTLTYITRHQLLVDPAVPYTSHNSAMCATLEGDIDEEELIAWASAFLRRTSASGSDPGLCVANAETLVEKDALLLWGKRALHEVLSKEEAYEVAKRCNVHLSEHGGTGQGVVGALAAVGLRLSGNNGRVRGKKLVEPGCMSVRELLEKTGFDCVCVCGEESAKEQPCAGEDGHEGRNGRNGYERRNGRGECNGHNGHEGLNGCGECEGRNGRNGRGEASSRCILGEELPQEALVHTETGVIKAVYWRYRSAVLVRLCKEGRYEVLEKQQLKAF